MVSGCLGISWFLGRTVRGLERELQPTDFPVEWGHDHATAVDLNSYRLDVVGAVSNPLHLTFDDLSAIPTVKRNAPISCDMGRIWESNVLWEGIPLIDLLALAKTSPQTLDHIVARSVTGYERVINAVDITNPATMIALKAEGAPLTVAHGYPARIVGPVKENQVHGRSGYMVKYVTKLICVAKSG